MVSTRASASVAVSAAPASAPTHTTLASRKRAAPAQRQANNKRRKLESESEADSSDSEASDYESGDKENLPEPATPRAARVLRRTSLAGVESPSSAKRTRTTSVSRPKLADPKTPTKPRKTLKAPATASPTKRLARLSLGNATNRRVIHSDDDASSSSSDTESDDEKHNDTTPDTSLEVVDDDVELAVSKTPFAQARALLRAPNATLVGRDNERRELTAYLVSRTAKSLYVSGTPGTGKTALVREVLASFVPVKVADDDADEEEARKVYVNCVGKREDAVWDAILEAVETVDLSASQSPRKKAAPISPSKRKHDGKREFERWLARESRKCILVLDEIDHLSPSTGVLASVFAMPAQINEPSSESVLRVIAISNSHTLAARSAHVSTLHFAPYDREQMTAISKAKLQALLDTPTLAPAKPFITQGIIALASAKVAAVTGDVRALVSLLVRTFDIAERRCAKNPDTTLSVLPPDVIEAVKSIQLVAAAKPSRAASAPMPAASATPSTTVTAAPPAAPKTKTGPTAGLALQPKLALLGLMLAKRRLAAGLSLGIMGTGTSAFVDPFSTLGSPKKSPIKGKVGSGRPKSPTKPKPTNDAIDASALHAFYALVLERSSSLSPVSRTEFADVLAVLEACGAVSMSSSGSRAFGRTSSFSGSAFGFGASAGGPLDVPDGVRSDDLFGEGVEGGLVQSVWHKETARIVREQPKAEEPQTMDVDDV